MKSGHRQAPAAFACLLIGLTPGATASSPAIEITERVAHEPPDSAMAAPFTHDEIVLIASFREAMQDPAVAAAAQREVETQIRINPPLAHVRGYWTTAVDLARLLERPEIGRVILDVSRRTVGDPRGPDRGGREDDPVRRLGGLVFTPHQSRMDLGLPRAEHLAVPDPQPPSRSDLYLVLIRDEKQVLLEYVPPEGATDCYYFCGDPETWDFDRDGVTNSRDEDDDGDGTSDEEDAFPFWPLESAHPRESLPFVAFTEKFSMDIAPLVLRAFDRLEARQREHPEAETEPASPAAARLRIVYP